MESKCDSLFVKAQAARLDRLSKMTLSRFKPAIAGDQSDLFKYFNQRILIDPIHEKRTLTLLKNELAYVAKMCGTPDTGQPLPPAQLDVAYHLPINRALQMLKYMRQHNVKFGDTSLTDSIKRASQPPSTSTTRGKSKRSSSRRGVACARAPENAQENKEQMAETDEGECETLDYDPQTMLHPKTKAPVHRDMLKTCVFNKEDHGYFNTIQQVGHAQGPEMMMDGEGDVDLTEAKASSVYDLFPPLVFPEADPDVQPGTGLLCAALYSIVSVLSSLLSLLLLRACADERGGPWWNINGQFPAVKFTVLYCTVCTSIPLDGVNVIVH